MELSKTFDVIIVGAGPAGCVLASRLSEESDRQILLIEAGPDAAAPGAEHPDVLDPFCLSASNNAVFHWPGLLVERSANRPDAQPVTTPYVQGYGVGGGSNINGMGVDRGQPDDYEEWSLLGAQGWGWTEVLPYFRKVERDLDFSHAAEHGTSGPMPVRRLPRGRWAPFTAAVGDAFQRRGFPYLDDYISDFRDGLASAPTNGLLDRRVSASMAYLTEGVRNRANLSILADTQVHRINVERNRATGVFARIARKHQRIMWGRQIILSCGAIQTPLLLMRSGVGPGADLTRNGIAPVRELPGVGANLQNHPCVTLVTHLARGAGQSADNPTFLQNWARFSSNRPGCVPGDMHVMAFNKLDWHYLGSRVGAVTVSVLKSYSKGRVRLPRGGPDSSPVVQFNLLDDARDAERLTAGLRFTLELLTDPLVKATRNEIFFPDARLVASLSAHRLWNGIRARTIALLLDCARLRHRLLAKARIDPERLLAHEGALREFIQAFAQPQFHPCGTCRMGRANDPSAVVDNAGRVFGVESLRVVDASIFPNIPRAYTHFVVLMVAEKLADVVKSDWRAEQASASAPGTSAVNQRTARTH